MSTDFNRLMTADCEQYREIVEEAVRVLFRRNRQCFTEEGLAQSPQAAQFLKSEPVFDATYRLLE